MTKQFCALKQKNEKYFKAMGISKHEDQKMKIPPKMKILQLTLKNFATIGVNPNLSLQPYPFNAKIFISVLILSSYLICNLVFLFYEAKTFTELIQSIYMSFCIASIIFCSAVIISNVNKLFQTINACENFVNTSECMASVLVSIPNFR